jgi:ribonuclease E
MPKSMLVNVTAEEENRVAIVDNGVLDVFEIETLSREHLKGNIFKVTVEGINPALEAAFVSYGGERAGFLPLDEVNFKLFPSRNGGGAGKGRGARISRHLDKGMELLVQVIRDSFANKPPTMSTYYSLPGRYLVLMPGADAGGISRKIEDAEHRDRLRKILDGLTIPPGFGVIVRTAGMDTSPKDLQADLESLLELWRTIEHAGQQVKAPALVFQERDLVLRTIRDYYTTDIEEVLIDDEAAFRRARKFFEAHMPDQADRVKLYTGDKPIFSKHNLEDQIERIYKRVVQLKSGGAISIDQAEALTAVDVNSARSVRSANSEDTAFRTNLEAAEEVARQLRLRDIGGLIVIDFIDMESPKHIRQVERVFAEAMSRDKARYDMTRISKLGLMEISRQRIKSSKATASFMECPTCSGDGTIRTPEAAARAAFRKIQARIVRGDIGGVKVFLPPDVALYLLNQKRDDLGRLETRHKVQVEVVPEQRLKASQFEIEEIHREEEDVTPIVTADTVDQAIVSGTIVPSIRPAEPQEPSRPREGAGEQTVEGAERQPRSRRRRRRRRGKGAEIGPIQDGATVTRAPALTARGSEAGSTGDPQLPLGEAVREPPVFSEGPETDISPAGSVPPPESRSPGPILPRVADLPVEAVAHPARRRRRRRRRRGRGAREGRPSATPTSQDSWSARASQGGNGSAVETPARPAPPSWLSPPSSSPPPAGSAHSGGTLVPAATDRPGAGSPATDQNQETEEKKPKRRWWRRAFKG